VPVSLPFLNVKLLGLIMIVAGLVKARALQRASSWLRRNRPKMMAARETLETLLETNAPAARHRRAGADQLAGSRFTASRAAA
jgi:hypothetical protein